MYVGFAVWWSLVAGCSSKDRWQTFASASYGVSAQYPKDWMAAEVVEQEFKETCKKLNVPYITTLKFCPSQRSLGQDNAYDCWRILVHEKTPTMEREVVDIHTHPDSTGYDAVKVQPIAIGGAIAYKHILTLNRADEYRLRINLIRGENIFIMTNAYRKDENFERFVSLISFNSVERSMLRSKI